MKTSWIAELSPGVKKLFDGASPQKALKGWDRVSWGDNYDSAQINYPQAQVSGENTLVMRPAKDVELNFSMSMKFDRVGHQLDSVSLKFEGSRQTKDFAELTRQISNRLGHPTSSTETTTTWTRDSTEVTISKSPGGGVVLSEIV